jgi:hypothetical protein
LVAASSLSTPAIFPLITAAVSYTERSDKKIKHANRKGTEKRENILCNFWPFRPQLRGRSRDSLSGQWLTKGRGTAKVKNMTIRAIITRKERAETKRLRNNLTAPFLELLQFNWKLGNQLPEFLRRKKVQIQFKTYKAV